ncbi:hypothetical protein VTK73DRAFT_7113 [Phialemonium thermophilum]|uniref:Uncharacterized protein n=1 Tax=Phialemonium thermophilum TaxID=223376 RepID=A0ABR3WGD3_9PEZI
MPTGIIRAWDYMEPQRVRRWGMGLPTGTTPETWPASRDSARQTRCWRDCPLVGRLGFREQGDGNGQIRRLGPESPSDRRGGGLASASSGPLLAVLDLGMEVMSVPETTRRFRMALVEGIATATPGDCSGSWDQQPCNFEFYVAGTRTVNKDIDQEEQSAKRKSQDPGGAISSGNQCGNVSGASPYVLVEEEAQLQESWPSSPYTWPAWPPFVVCLPGPPAARATQLGAAAVFDHHSQTEAGDIHEYAKGSLCLAVDCLTDASSMAGSEALGPGGGH